MIEILTTLATVDVRPTSLATQLNTQCAARGSAARGSVCDH